MGLAKAEKDLSTAGIKVSIRLPTGKIIPITLHPYDQMSKLYSLAATELSVQEKLVKIKYTGKVIQRTQTARTLGVLSDMVFKAESLQEVEFSLSVRYGDKPEDLHNVFVKNTSTPRDILARLEDTESDLYYGTKKLPKTEMLYDLKIPNNASLTAQKREAASCRSSKKNLDAKENPTTTDDHVVESLTAFATDGRPVEVVFSFDTTGSMYSVLQKVREDLKETIERLLKDVPGIRIGLIAHGDYCDYSKYVVKYHDLSDNSQSLAAFAMGTPSTGGGDSPECYELVLRKATEMDWSEDSAKALVVIGDSTPHPPSMTDQDIYWHTELDVLHGMGVKVYGVHARADSSSRSFYKELADRTNGAYITFSNFSLIKEMFLAVCYNEAGTDHLNEFMSELESATQSMDQNDSMYKQLQQQQCAAKEDKAARLAEQNIAFDPRQSKNYVRTAWFDRSLDDNGPTRVPSYTYDHQLDKWGPYKPRTPLLSGKETFSEPFYPTPVIKTKSNSKRLRFLSCFARH